MKGSVPASISQEVWARSQGRCEYCRIRIEDCYFGGEIDHIVSLKHGGETTPANLAISCQPYNRYKGTDLGSIISDPSEITRFFNPRSDHWNEHFLVSADQSIRPLSDIGRVTVRIFRFNDQARILERKGLAELGRY